MRFSYIKLQCAIGVADTKSARIKTKRNKSHGKKVVPLDEKTSNDLFDVFADWEHHFKDADVAGIERLYSSEDDECDDGDTAPTNNFEEPQP
jgi:hypothetical protein